MSLPSFMYIQPNDTPMTISQEEASKSTTCTKEGQANCVFDENRYDNGYAMYSSNPSTNIGTYGYRTAATMQKNTQNFVADPGPQNDARATIDGFLGGQSHHHQNSKYVHYVLCKHEVCYQAIRFQYQLYRLHVQPLEH